MEQALGRRLDGDGDDMDVSLSRRLDERMALDPHGMGIVVRADDGASEDASYLAMGLGEFAAERDAWAFRLREAGIIRRERVAVALPLSLAYLAICYALMKIGSIPVLIPRRAEGPEAMEELNKLGCKGAVGTAGFVKRVKAFFGGVRSVEATLKVADPFRRIASAGRSAAEEGVSLRGIDAGLAIVDCDGRGGARSYCFKQRQIGAMLAAYRERFEVAAGEIDLQSHYLFSLFNPALGVATVLARGVSGASKVWMEAIHDLRVSSVWGETGRLRDILEVGVRTGLRLDSLKRVCALDGAELPLGLAEFPGLAETARVYSVFGTAQCPLLAVADVGAAARGLPSSRFRLVDLPLGDVVSGVECRLIPVNRDAKAHLNLSFRDVKDDPEEGELVIRGPLLGMEADAMADGMGEGWRCSGRLVLRGKGGALLYGGEKRDLVATPVGSYFAARCEAVFLSHPSVAACALLAGKRQRKICPVLVVEPTDGRYPKNKRERLRFEASLFRLGADYDETRLILNIEFAKRIPRSRDGVGGIDRSELRRKFG